jgi:cytochrome o ubiquinol oxidase subunit II
VLIKFLTEGKNIAILNPKGQIAEQQYDIMVFTAVAMLAIAIPSLTLFYYFAWKYRDSSKKAIIRPSASHSKALVVSIWVIPTLVALLIAGALVPATYRLAPQKIIASDTEPLTIKVIAMRWKWLFLFPEEGIATVNFVQIPVDRPVTFEMTADEVPMSSFWIPNLGGQLYVMTSHTNRINLIANEAGDFPGSTPEITGSGFTGMKFIARATSVSEYDQWVETVRLAPDNLSSSAYEELIEPSKNNPIALYSAYDKDLYDKVIMKYSGSGDGELHDDESADEGHGH